MRAIGVSISAFLLGVLGIGPCDEVQGGGAVITFAVEQEEISLHITNDAFIDEAIVLLGQGNVRVPNFEEVIAGTDADPDWSWHVHPEKVAWADMTIEVCDATPSYIEEHLDAWIEDVGRWCPWGASVVDVQDLRPAE